ncbi:heparan-alpha-glucosaminide N-acetyltransferase [Tabrizicola sp.]|uniref:heparan-alpha-glucosaminide N-acetyltransferase n=1 Tax=Tabrizicola sp. TaxID=2005166 RepID=UPI00261CE50F|nr:heparan-alpha-glucosaminide N-acetyltransferase [Tabrizicola sp.]MDM7932529.1 heparan-alpha-glucosaminide N-acetyltransferase [Tabrizicola sp.]
MARVAANTHLRDSLTGMAIADTPLPPGRLIVLDLARSLALVGMVVFHFTFDLALFGFVPVDTIYQPFWYYFARMVAGSFLFLSGVSLWLAHGQGIRWMAFWWRFAKIATAAALVTLASFWLVPGGPIHFGILHALAVSGLIALAFLRLPGLVTLAVAAGVFALGWADPSPMFDGLALVWLGLAENRPLMGDYVPLVPWLAPCLAGLALAKLVGLHHWQGQTPTRLWRIMAFPGQHSLVIYLIHQPILFGLFNAFVWATRG